MINGVFPCTQELPNCMMTIRDTAGTRKYRPVSLFAHIVVEKVSLSRIPFGPWVYRVVFIIGFCIQRGFGWSQIAIMFDHFPNCHIMAAAMTTLHRIDRKPFFIVYVFGS